MLRKSFAGLFVLVSLLIPFTVPAAAHAAASIFTNTLVYDDFDTLTVRPDDGAYWYAINWGDYGPTLGSYGDASSSPLNRQTA